jgi:hypothetical protein
VIVSFEHRFAFIKVQKTAGTSIEVFLSQVAGPDAIVTPINPPEPGHEARNFEARPGDRATPGGGASRWRRKRPAAPSGADEPAFYNHMPASLVCERLGAACWDGLYRFCFERNPWDKAVSFYFWRTRRLADPPPFEEWATRPGSLVSERMMYTTNDTLDVDFVGRYETLTADLQSVLDHTGVTTSIALPRAKGEHRPVGERTPIGPAADACIRAEFAWEIDHFGYTRPEAIPWE